MAVCIAIGLFGLSLLLVEPLALCLRTLICPRVSFSARQQQRTRVATYTPTLAGVIVVFSFRARGARGRCVRSRLRVAVRSRCGGGVTVVTGADVALALLGGRFVAAVRIMPCRAGRCMRVAVAVRRSRDGRWAPAALREVDADPGSGVSSRVKISRSRPAASRTRSMRYGTSAALRCGGLAPVELA
jgi:hypothetical protein